MKKSSRDIPENDLKKAVAFLPIEDDEMKKHFRNKPGSDSENFVLVMESEVSQKKMGSEDIIDILLNDALTHCNKVAAGEITARKSKLPPKTIERMIAEEVYRETMCLDHGAVDKLLKKIKSVNDAIKYHTDTRTRLLDEREQNEKGILREIVKIKRSEINSKIHCVDNEIDRHKKSREKLVKMLEETKKTYCRELDAAVERAIKRVDETMPWEMRVMELKPGRLKPGRRINLKDLNEVIRDIGIINGYKEELANDSGPSEPGQKKRVIQKMVEKLKAVGKRRTGYEKIRKILAARGIK